MEYQMVRRGEYEETLKDIENTFGFVPGFVKAVPKEVLVKDWPLMKKYLNDGLFYLVFVFN